MNKIRAFIAIHLTSDARNELARVNEILASRVPHQAVRWVKPELMHITLRFLGDTAVSILPSLYTALDKSTAQHDAFSLSLDQLGCFPNCKRPRVIWAGIKGQLDAANVLKQDIDSALQTLGWEQEERPFRPHLTIGRVKDKRNLRISQWGVNIEKVTLPVQEIQLIESKLASTGPIYTERHTSRLRIP